METFRQSGKLVLYYQNKWQSLAVQSWFVTYRKKLEEADFVEEKFLHKKVNKNGVFMKIMVCYKRYSRRYTYLR